MPEIKNTFAHGKMDKDLDQRIVPNGQYRDAMNIQVSTSENSDVGTVQNILGNRKITIPGRPDIITGDWKCVGAIEDEKNDTIYWFIYNFSKKAIIEYKKGFGDDDGITTPILVDLNNDVLNFSGDIITGINIIDDLLLWTDGSSEPKKININTFKLNNHTDLTIHSHFFVNGDDVGEVEEKHITVIKEKPTKAPTLELIESSRSGLTSSQTIPIAFSNGSVLLQDGETVTITVPITNFSIISGFIPVPISMDWKEDDILLLSEPALAGNLPENYQIRIKIKTVFSVQLDSITIGVPFTFSQEFECEIENINIGVNVSAVVYDVELEDLTPTLFQKTFPRFACRYKYEDGEYSAIGPFTEASFLPHKFSFHPTKEPYNSGMINRVKSVTLKDFVAADIPDGVVQIDLLYKEENLTNIYSINSVKRNDENWLANGSDSNSNYKGSYTIEDENIYAVLPEGQILRHWDNIPRTAKAQEITGNRLVYANYLQSFNLNDINGELVKTDLRVGYRERKFRGGEEIIFEKGQKSIKSLRNYQLGVVYGDKYGRETPVFTSEHASISVPHDASKSVSFDGNASRSNQIWAALHGDQPHWAEYYKIFIKETSDEYYNLAMDRVYKAEEDGNLWISFPSSDRNKLKEDDYIILKKTLDSDDQVSIENKFKVIAIENQAPEFIKYKYLQIGQGGGSASDIASLYTNYITGSGGVGVPAEEVDTIIINKDFWINTEFGTDLEDIEEKLYIIWSITTSGNALVRSERYEVTSLEMINSNAQYRLKLGKPITNNDAWIESSASGTLTSGTLNTSLDMSVYKRENKDLEEFAGRFFVKILSNTVTNEFIEPQIGTILTYSVVGSGSMWWLADTDANGTNPSDGIVNTTYNWTGNTNAVTSASLPSTNTRVGWVELHAQSQSSSTIGKMFIDNMYFASAQATWNPYNASSSGKLWKGSGGVDGVWEVNGLEGIVLTDPTAEPYLLGIAGTNTGGSRTWATHRTGAPNYYKTWDDTYEGLSVDSNGKHVFMHLSFSNCGRDLASQSDYQIHGAPGGSNYPLSFYNQSGSPNWGKSLARYSNIRATNNFRAVTPFPELFCSGTQGFAAQNPDIYKQQWKPWINASGGVDDKIKNIIEKLNPGQRFRFEGGEQVYTILKVKKKYLYNHTSWDLQYKWDGTTTNPTIINSGLVPRQNSVEWYARECHTNNGFTIHTQPNSFKDDVVNAAIRFGGRDNRRVCYILELDIDPTDSTLNGGVNPLDTASATANTKIRFIDEYIEPNVALLSDNPALWETEPKDKSELDIYYEASQAIPINLDSNILPNPDNNKSELFAPIGSKVWCSKSGSQSTAPNFGDCVITSWDGNIVELSPGLDPISTFYVDTTGDGVLDTTLSPSTTSENDQTSVTFSNIEYKVLKGSTLRFFRDDMSFTTSTIYRVDEIDSVSGFITKIAVNFSGYGNAVGLPYYNCISFGNGLESDRIRDDFNQVMLHNGVKANMTLETQYKEEHRKTGLIYSGIYNSTSGINNLNQFVMAEKITKDLNPVYGSIQKLHTRDTNLVTLCEDKCLKILVDKDALFNADGSPQLLAKTGVLGTAVPFIGEYGISKNPESFASESYRAYFTDKQRGAVLRLSKDGLTPISDAGMSSYFKDSLKISNELIGTYDEYKKDYNLTIKVDSLNLVPNSNFQFSSNSNELLLNGDFSQQTTGAQLVPNPHFNAGSSGWGLWGTVGTEVVWTAQGANYGIISFVNAVDYNKLNLFLSTTSVGENFFVEGRAFEIEFTISNYDMAQGGALIIKLNGGNYLVGSNSPGDIFYLSPNNFTSGNLDGTHKITLQLGAGTPSTAASENGRFYIANNPNYPSANSNSSFTGDIDNVTIREVKALYWNTPDGNWVTNNSEAEHIGDVGQGVGNLIQQNNNNPNLALVASKEYELKMNVSGGTGSDLKLINVVDDNGSLGDLDIVRDGNEATAVWEQLDNSFSPSVNDDKIVIYHDGDGVIDNVSLKEVSVPNNWEVTVAGNNFVKKVNNAVRLFHDDANATIPHTNIHTVDTIIEPGKLYDWEVEITDWTAGALNFDIGGSNPEITGGTYIVNEGFNDVGLNKGTLRSNATSPQQFMIKRGRRASFGSQIGRVDVTFTNVKLSENVDDAHKTVTFSEDVRGWTSFKSFIPDYGISVSNDYYTFNHGKLYKHHDKNVTYNTFYDNHTNSSVTAVMNDMSGQIKTFNTLNYTGSQAKIDQFTTETVDSIEYNDSEFYNLGPDKDGWFVESIITEKQEGSLNEFIEKEGKWFNYIKGREDVIDTSAFNFQGIGVAQNIE